MPTPPSRLPRIGALGAVLALLLAGVALTAWARAPDETRFTACLRNGSLSNVAVGEDPAAPCRVGATEVRWNAEGDRGATWFSGPDTPGSELGRDGDFYFHLATGDVFVKEAGTWTTRASLAGPSGPPGPEGPPGPPGPPGTIAVTRTLDSEPRVPVTSEFPDFTVIGRNALEPGTYLVHAHAELAARQGWDGTRRFNESVLCQTTGDADLFDVSAFGQVFQDAWHLPFVFESLVTVSSTTEVTLECALMDAALLEHGGFVRVDLEEWIVMRAN